ncbi:hypothetical protein CPB97_000438 [Podila verticillata]|nr:hypothetical protein CPB97_000438 [Podila verticillata]
MTTSLHQHPQPQQTTNTNPSGIHRLSVEILVMIGNRLRGPELLAALQVCRMRHDALRHLSWSQLYSSQLNQCGNPLNSFYTEGDISRFTTELQDLRFLELQWSDRDSYDFVIDLLEDNEDVKSLTLQRLRDIIQLATNLTTLTLEDPISDYLSMVLPSLLHHPSLRELIMEDYESLPQNQLDITDMFPVFERLEKLELIGNFGWYRPLFWNQNMDILALEYPSWSVRSLSITAREMLLLAFCPQLEILRVQGLHEQDPSISMRPTLRCPRLQELVLECCSDQSCFEDFSQVIVHLATLKKLSLNLHSVDEISALCFPLLGTNTMPLPNLEHLTFSEFNRRLDGDYRTSQGSYKILLNRPKLKAVQMPIMIGPEYHRYDMPELHEPWACSGLEELTTILWSPHGLTYAPDFWLSIARQLASLPNLRRLSVDFTNARGDVLFWALFRVGGLPVLQLLALPGVCVRINDHMLHRYLAAWLELFPKLHQLVVPNDRVEKYVAWLRAIRRPDIEVERDRDSETWSRKLFKTIRLYDSQ